jgi:hypothetical protein
MKFLIFLKPYNMQNKFYKPHQSFKMSLPKIIGFSLLTFLILNILLFASCKKEPDPPPPDPSDNLAIDSLVATKKTVVTWEETFITAYARGKNLQFHWSANHGSMIGTDSVTVDYYACESCLGYNTIECKVSNEYGTVSDTVMIQVNPGK